MQYLHVIFYPSTLQTDPLSFIWNLISKTFCTNSHQYFTRTQIFYLCSHFHQVFRQAQLAHHKLQKYYQNHFIFTYRINHHTINYKTKKNPKQPSLQPFCHQLNPYAIVSSSQTTNPALFQNFLPLPHFSTLLGWKPPSWFRFKIPFSIWDSSKNRMAQKKIVSSKNTWEFLTLDLRSNSSHKQTILIRIKFHTQDIPLLFNIIQKYSTRVVNVF